jgi:hypothetical protein
MRIILTATAATLLLAQLAFAQNPNAGAAPASPQAGQSTPQAQDPSQAQNPQIVSAMISAKLQKSLEDAGFSDIQIMPSSFLVRAKDRDGNPVMMVINPDSVTAVKETGSRSMPNQGSTTGTPGRNSMPSGR